jgi:hypothetical protein
VTCLISDLGCFGNCIAPATNRNTNTKPFIPLDFKIGIKRFIRSESGGSNNITIAVKQQIDTTSFRLIAYNTKSEHNEATDHFRMR